MYGCHGFWGNLSENKHKQRKYTCGYTYSPVPHTSIAKVVVREEAAMFTILFPIRMVLKNLELLSIRDNTRTALFDPSSASDLIFRRLSEVKAVSAEEKKADNSKSMIRIIKRAAAPGSKKITLLQI